MKSASDQLDRRFDELLPLAEKAKRPARGWVKAVREALGMTSAQLARRMGVAQPRIAELEKAETQSAVTLRSLERAAEAMGCRLVYLFVPARPLSETLQARAAAVAGQKLAAVEQTMRLEDQAVADEERRRDALQALTEQLLRKPARLWDGP